MALSRIDTTNMIEDVPQSKLDNNINFRNIIINGDMSIAQRGTSFSCSNSSGDTYTLDRFEYKNEVYHAVINNDLPNKRCHFDVDIIGTIFILLSRYEEHVLNRESHFDKFGRFKYILIFFKNW